MGKDRLRNPLLQGVLVLDKPAGLTSQEAVSRARAGLRIKKMGHAGTLDPIATGVLPLMINSATRIAPLLGSDDKVYRAVMRLGIATDTLDPTGTVLEEKPVEGIAEARLAEVLLSFVGEIEQIPPMYSAVKVKGERLYELARRNIEIERKPKQVTIHGIELLSVDLPHVTFTVHCSSGTYVRVIASEAGAALGCGAHVSELVRTRSGAFRMEDAVSMAVVDDAGGKFRDIERERTDPEAPKRWRWPHAEAATWWEDELGESLRSVPQATGLQPLVLDGAVLARILHGESVRAEALSRQTGLDFEAGQTLLVTGDGRHVAAIVRATCRADLVPKMPERAVVLEVTRVLRS